MAAVPNLGSRDPMNADRPAGNASNGLPPGTKGRLLKGGGAIGGAAEAHHQPTRTNHPQGPFVDRSGQRYKIDFK